MEFKPENTAIVRRKPSSPLSFLLKRYYFISKKHHKIFDYGCGRGYDVTWLCRNGYDAIGWDLYWGNATKPGPDEKFDTVLCTYVLNAIDDPKERVSAMRDAWRYVAPGGVLFVSMHTESEIASAAEKGGWERHGDGYISSKSMKTFQKGFTCKSVRELLTLVCTGAKFSEMCARTKEFAYLIVTR